MVIIKSIIKYHIRILKNIVEEATLGKGKGPVTGESRVLFSLID